MIHKDKESTSPATFLPSSISSAGILFITVSREPDRIRYGLRGPNGRTWREYYSDKFPQGSDKALQNLIDMMENNFQDIEKVITDNIHDEESILSDIGRNISLELFGRAQGLELVNHLFDIKDEIEAIQMCSSEIIAPWEILRLYDPKNKRLDDKFLCEYGLFHELKDSPQQKIDLNISKIKHLWSEYPAALEQAIPECLFEGENTEEFSIPISKVAPQLSNFQSALRKCDFDILHLCCHGHDELASPDKGTLILGDGYDELGDPMRLKVSLKDVTKIINTTKCQISDRRPIVFLNACETGITNIRITQSVGWAEAFIYAGAGVFIGTAWKVRSKVAARFAQTLYLELAKGSNLAKAAQLARQSAQSFESEKGERKMDATSFAYRFFGNPLAHQRIDDEL